MNQQDKMSDKPIAQSSSLGFRGFVQSCGLIDIGFSGAQYTWNNRRSGSTNIQEQLMGFH